MSDKNEENDKKVEEEEGLLEVGGLNRNVSIVKSNGQQQGKTGILSFLELQIQFSSLITVIPKRGDNPKYSIKGKRYHAHFE